MPEKDGFEYELLPKCEKCRFVDVGKGWDFNNMPCCDCYRVTSVSNRNYFQPKAEFKYKVGDKVWVKTAVNGKYSVGKPGFIVEIDEADEKLPYAVGDGKPGHYWCSENDLEEAHDE